MSKFRFIFIFLLGALALGGGLVEAAPGDTTADAVLGQANFNSNSANGGGAVNAAGFEWPYGIAIDNQSGRLYAADYDNNRILSWPNVEAFTSGAAADRVIGQPNFTSGAANQGIGPGANTLHGPVGLIVDQRTGRLYVSDFLNNRVLSYAQPITTGMTADQVYGQPNFTTNAPNSGGLGAGSLKNPWGLAFDSDGGFLFVADFGNHRVLVISPDFSHNALDVFGQPDFTSNTPNNGGVSSYSLNQPTGTAYDESSNTLVIADSGNNRVLIDVRDVTPSYADYVLGQNGSFTTNTNNNGGISSKSLYAPTDVSFDSAGDLYVADRYNNRVLFFDLNLTGSANDTADQVFGQPNFTSNTANNGGVSANSLYGPYAIIVTPSQNLLVSDRTNNRILRYDLPRPFGQPYIFDVGPRQVAVGSQSFQLLVRGAGFVRQSVVTWNGQSLTTTYLNPTHVVATVPAVNVSSDFTAQIKVVNPAPGGISGITETVSGYQIVPNDTTADRILGQSAFDIYAWFSGYEIGVGPRTIDAPTGIAVHPVNGHLYAASNDQSRIQSWPSAANFANGSAADMVIGQPDLYMQYPNTGGISASSLAHPRQIAFDSSGNLYAADVANHRVLVYLDPVNGGPVADFVFGQPGFTSGDSNNGGVSANSLKIPTGVAVGPDGTVYIADTDNNRVLIYLNPLATDRTADIVLGQVNFTDNGWNQGNANPGSNTLNQPTGLALDNNGRLYVADTDNHRVLVFSPPFTNGKAASFVLGQPSFTTATANNGGVSANSLYLPYAVAVDAAQNLYIADYSNNRVLAYNQPVALDDRTADLVFGQPTFTSNTPNNPSLSASALSFPAQLTLDSNGDLYISDFGNNRLLAYKLTSQTSFNQAVFLPIVIR